MSIDEVYKINTNVADETSTVKKTLSYIHEQAVGHHFVDTEPTDVPVGKLVIYDDGATRRLYIRTGKGSIGYVTLTMI